MVKRLLFCLLHPLWRLTDLLIAKRADHWAFTTHHLHTDRFIENQRALFEHIKTEPDIRKIIFYRGTAPDFQIENAVNYEVVPHGTLRGLFLLARCRVVFLTHSVSMDYSLRWGGRQFSILKLAMNNRLIVNLWHGIPLKRLLYTANDATFRHTDRVKYRSKERCHYTGLIASSDIDGYTMAAMFYPLNYRQIWTTGLPRNDFLTQEEEQLPIYIRDSLQRVRQLRQGKKLIIYAPTYRQTDISRSARYYQFSAAEIEALKALLHAQNAVLGYRPHYFRNSDDYFNLDQYVDNESIFDLSQSIVPEFSALARECDVLVTDYSSVYIEAMYLGKPVICFGYDIEHYMANEDGLLYDMKLAFPGPVVRRFDELLVAITERMSADSARIEEEQATAKQLFFKYDDAMNSRRVKEEVMKRLQITQVPLHPHQVRSAPTTCASESLPRKHR